MFCFGRNLRCKFSGGADILFDNGFFEIVPMHKYQEHTRNDCQQKRSPVTTLHNDQNRKKDTGQQRRCNTCIQKDDQQGAKENNGNSKPRVVKKHHACVYRNTLATFKVHKYWKTMAQHTTDTGNHACMQQIGKQSVMIWHAIFIGIIHCARKLITNIDSFMFLYYIIM